MCIDIILFKVGQCVQSYRQRVAIMKQFFFFLETGLDKNDGTPRKD